MVEEYRCQCGHSRKRHRRIRDGTNRRGLCRARGCACQNFAGVVDLDLLQAQCDGCGETFPLSYLECDMEMDLGPYQAQCVGCGKRFCLFATSGCFGDREPEGVLIEGAPYCCGCLEKLEVK